MRWGLPFVVVLTGCSVLFDVGSLRTDGAMEAGADAGMDTAVIESGTDASSDAADAGTSDAKPDGRWCDSVNPAPIFCDDFDVGNFGAGWMTDMSGGGTVGASNMGLSPPTAVRTTTPGASSVVKTACLTKGIASTYGTVELGYDLYIVTKPSGGGIEVGDVGVTVGNDSWYVGLILGAMDMFFAEHDGQTMTLGYQSTPMASIPIGQWKRVEWVFRPKAGTATLTIAGVQIFDGALPSYGFTSGEPWFAAGVVYEDKSNGASEILVDNVVVRVAQ